MREKIKRYARRLESLSIDELSRSAEKLVSFQRRNDAALIAHLVEISRRRGHLELGYKNLFDYCQERLRLGDGGAVWRRTQVAGVARCFPQVLEHLARGRVNLSVLAILATHLTEENVDGLLKEAEGKTTREVKEIVAAISPKPAAESTIRRKPARSREESAEAGRVSAEFAPPPQEEVKWPAAPVRAPEPERRLVGNVEVARPEVYNFKFSAGKDFREKLERLGEVLGIANSARRMSEILEQAVDLALEKKDPRKKLERRRKREKATARREASFPSRRTGSEGAPPAMSPPPEEVIAETREGSRYVPSAVRERVLERAGYQCEYRGPDGTRCMARTRLEVDHIKPHRKGGGRGEENLRMFCKGHNLLAAAREFGEEFIRGKIESGKQRAR